MGPRTFVRAIYFMFRRPKMSLFLWGVFCLIPAAFLILTGIRYVLGDARKVDLSEPDCDYSAVGDYTRVTGNTYLVWDSFSTRSSDGSGSLNYYLVPQFDNEQDPQYITSVLIVKVEPEDKALWDTAKSNTMKWYTRTATKPVSPLRVDGYAHKTTGTIMNSAAECLMKNGFTQEQAWQVLVPYLVSSSNNSAKYTSFSIGGVFALISIVCLGAWVKKGANFRD